MKRPNRITHFRPERTGRAYCKRAQEPGHHISLAFQKSHGNRIAQK